MPADWTTTNGLIPTIKRRAMMPTSQLLYTDAEILELANDELIDTIVPFVMSCQEDHWLATTDTAYDASTAEVSVPARAIGVKLKAVAVLSAGSEYELPRISISVWLTSPMWPVIPKRTQGKWWKPQSRSVKRSTI